MFKLYYLASGDRQKKSGLLGLRLTRRERLAHWPLLTLAVQWFEACRGLRAWENAHLLENPTPEHLHAHRVQISDLIADGEMIAWQAKKGKR